MKHWFRKSVSALVIFLFAVNSCFADAVSMGIEFSHTAERPQLIQIDIPAELASVDEFWEAPARPNPKMILHIQNAHTNYEAQSKIRDLMAYLNKNYGFKTIFVEGASEDLNPDYLKLFPDAETNRKLWDELAKRGQITGADWFLLDGPKEAKGVGIEKAELYRKNYEALKAVYSREAETTRFLGGLESELDKLASKMLPPQKRNILSEWKKFEKGHREFIPFVSTLAKLAKENLNLDLQGLYSQIEWPQLTRLLVLQQMEKKLKARATSHEPRSTNESRATNHDSRITIEQDVARGSWSVERAADSERQQMIALLKSKNVSKELIAGLERFNEKNINLNRIRASSGKMESLPRFFIEKLIQEAGPKGLKFSDYPNFALYTGYLILKYEIEPSALFEEIRKLFDKLLDSAGGQRPTTNTKKGDKRSALSVELIQLFRDVELVRKLFSLELSRGEWGTVLARKAGVEPSKIFERVKNLGTQNPKLKAQSQSSKPSGYQKEILTAFENAFSFYDIAVRRDEVFYEKMAKELEHTDRAILMTGGFHTEGMKEIFRDKEISYGTLTPRLTNVESSNLYRDVMLGKSATSFHVSTVEIISRLQNWSAQESEGDLAKDIEGLFNAFFEVGKFSDLKIATDVFNQAVSQTGYQLSIEDSAIGRLKLKKQGSPSAEIIVDESGAVLKAKVDSQTITRAESRKPTWEDNLMKRARTGFVWAVRRTAFVSGLVVNFLGGQLSKDKNRTIGYWVERGIKGAVEGLFVLHELDDNASGSRHSGQYARAMYLRAGLFAVPMAGLIWITIAFLPAYVGISAVAAFGLLLNVLVFLTGKLHRYLNKSKSDNDESSVSPQSRSAEEKTIRSETRLKDLVLRIVKVIKKQKFGFWRAAFFVALTLVPNSPVVLPLTWMYDTFSQHQFSRTLWNAPDYLLLAGTAVYYLAMAAFSAISFFILYVFSGQEIHRFSIIRHQIDRIERITPHPDQVTEIKELKWLLRVRKAINATKLLMISDFVAAIFILPYSLINSGGMLFAGAVSMMGLLWAENKNKHLLNRDKKHVFVEESQPSAESSTRTRRWVLFSGTTMLVVMVAIAAFNTILLSERIKNSEHFFDSANWELSLVKYDAETVKKINENEFVFVGNAGLFKNEKGAFVPMGLAVVNGQKVSFLNTNKIGKRLSAEAVFVVSVDGKLDIILTEDYLRDPSKYPPTLYPNQFQAGPYWEKPIDWDKWSDEEKKESLKRYVDWHMANPGRKEILGLSANGVSDRNFWGNDALGGTGPGREAFAEQLVNWIDQRNLKKFGCVDGGTTGLHPGMKPPLEAIVARPAKRAEMRVGYGDYKELVLALAKLDFSNEWESSWSREKFISNSELMRSAENHRDRSYDSFDVSKPEDNFWKKVFWMKETGEKRTSEEVERLLEFVSQLGHDHLVLSEKDIQAMVDVNLVSRERWGESDLVWEEQLNLLFKNRLVSEAEYSEKAPNDIALINTAANYGKGKEILRFEIVARLENGERRVVYAVVPGGAYHVSSGEIFRFGGQLLNQLNNGEPDALLKDVKEIDFIRLVHNHPTDDYDNTHSLTKQNMSWLNRTDIGNLGLIFSMFTVGGRKAQIKVKATQITMVHQGVESKGDAQSILRHDSPISLGWLDDSQITEKEIQDAREAAKLLDRLDLQLRQDAFLQPLGTTVSEIKPINIRAEMRRVLIKTINKTSRVDAELVRKFKQLIHVEDETNRRVMPTRVSVEDHSNDRLNNEILNENTEYSPYELDLMQFFVDEAQAKDAGGIEIPIYYFPGTYRDGDGGMGDPTSANEFGRPFVWFGDKVLEDDRIARQILFHEMSHVRDSLLSLKGDADLKNYTLGEGRFKFYYPHVLAYREFRANLWSFSDDIDRAFKATLASYTALRNVFGDLTDKTDARDLYRALEILTHENADAFAPDSEAVEGKGKDDYEKVVDALKRAHQENRSEMRVPQFLARLAGKGSAESFFASESTRLKIKRVVVVIPEKDSFSWSILEMQRTLPNWLMEQFPNAQIELYGGADGAGDVSDAPAALRAKSRANIFSLIRSSDVSGKVKVLTEKPVSDQQDTTLWIGPMGESHQGPRLSFMGAGASEAFFESRKNGIPNQRVSVESDVNLKTASAHEVNRAILSKLGFKESAQNKFVAPAMVNPAIEEKRAQLLNQFASSGINRKAKFIFLNPLTRADDGDQSQYLNLFEQTVRNVLLQDADIFIAFNEGPKAWDRGDAASKRFGKQFETILAGLKADFRERILLLDRSDLTADQELIRLAALMTLTEQTLLVTAPSSPVHIAELLGVPMLRADGGTWERFYQAPIPEDQRSEEFGVIPGTSETKMFFNLEARPALLGDEIRRYFDDLTDLKRASDSISNQSSGEPFEFEWSLSGNNAQNGTDRAFLNRVLLNWLNDPKNQAKLKNSLNPLIEGAGDRTLDVSVEPDLYEGGGRNTYRILIGNGTTSVSFALKIADSKYSIARELAVRDLELNEEIRMTSSIRELFAEEYLVSDIFKEDGDGRLYLLLSEWIEGETIRSFLERNPEETIRKKVFQALIANIFKAWTQHKVSTGQGLVYDVSGDDVMVRNPEEVVGDALPKLAFFDPAKEAALPGSDVERLVFTWSQIVKISGFESVHFETFDQLFEGLSNVDVILKPFLQVPASPLKKDFGLFMAQVLNLEGDGEFYSQLEKWIDSRAEARSENREAPRSELRAEALEEFKAAVRELTGKPIERFESITIDVDGEKKLVSLEDAFMQLQKEAADESWDGGHQVKVSFAKEPRTLIFELLDQNGREVKKTGFQQELKYEKLLLEIVKHLRDEMTAFASSEQSGAFEIKVTPLLDSISEKEFDSLNKVTIQIVPSRKIVVAPVQPSIVYKTSTVVPSQQIIPGLSYLWHEGSRAKRPEDVKHPENKHDDSNQDRASAFQVKTEAGDATVLMMFDGHGKNGAKAAQLANDLFKKEINSVLGGVDKDADVEILIRSAFEKVDAQMKETKAFPDAGTTASIAIVWNGFVYMFSLGDSPIYLIDRNNPASPIVAVSLVDHDKNLIGASLGHTGDDEIDLVRRTPMVSLYKLQPHGDYRLLLGSDGILPNQGDDNANAESIGKAVKDQENGEAALRAILGLFEGHNQSVPSDNFTAMILKVNQRSEMRELEEEFKMQIKSAIELANGLDYGIDFVEAEFLIDDKNENVRTKPKENGHDFVTYGYEDSTYVKWVDYSVSDNERTSSVLDLLNEAINVKRLSKSGRFEGEWLEFVPKVKMIGYDQKANRYWVQYQGIPNGHDFNSDEFKAQPIWWKLRALQSMAKLVSKLNGFGLMHRDLKPGNFIFNVKGELMLIDFGNAGKASETWHELSPQFASPRLRGFKEGRLDEKPEWTILDEIYSFGKTLEDVFPEALKSDEIPGVPTYLRNLSHLIQNMTEHFPDGRKPNTMQAVSEKLDEIAQLAQKLETRAEMREGVRLALQSEIDAARDVHSILLLDPMSVPAAGEGDVLKEDAKSNGYEAVIHGYKDGSYVKIVRFKKPGNFESKINVARNLIHEAINIKRLSGLGFTEGVPQFIQMGWDTAKQELWIQCRGIENGYDLGDEERVKKLTIAFKVSLVKKITDLLAKMAESDGVLLHRDIKPENILINDEGKWLVIDFGNAGKANSDDPVEDYHQVTTDYASPKIDQFYKAYIAAQMALRQAQQENKGEIQSLEAEVARLENEKPAWQEIDEVYSLGRMLQYLFLEVNKPETAAAQQEREALGLLKALILEMITEDENQRVKTMRMVNERLVEIVAKLEARAEMRNDMPVLAENGLPWADEAFRNKKMRIFVKEEYDGNEVKLGYDAVRFAFMIPALLKRFPNATIEVQGLHFAQMFEHHKDRARIRVVAHPDPDNEGYEYPLAIAQHSVPGKPDDLKAAYYLDIINLAAYGQAQSRLLSRDGQLLSETTNLKTQNKSIFWNEAEAMLRAWELIDGKSDVALNVYDHPDVGGHQVDWLRLIRTADESQFFDRKISGKPVPPVLQRIMNFQTMNEIATGVGKTGVIYVNLDAVTQEQTFNKTFWVQFLSKVLHANPHSHLMFSGGTNKTARDFALNVAEELIQYSSGGQRIFVLPVIDSSRLAQVWDFMAVADAVITPNTGFMHMAHAAGRPLLVVDTSEEFTKHWSSPAEGTEMFYLLDIRRIFSYQAKMAEEYVARLFQKIITLKGKRPAQHLQKTGFEFTRFAPQFSRMIDYMSQEAEKPGMSSVVEEWIAHYNELVKNPGNIETAYQAYQAYFQKTTADERQDVVGSYDAKVVNSLIAEIEKQKKSSVGEVQPGNSGKQFLSYMLWHLHQFDPVNGLAFLKPIKINRSEMRAVDKILELRKKSAGTYRVLVTMDYSGAGLGDQGAVRLMATEISKIPGVEVSAAGAGVLGAVEVSPHWESFDPRSQEANFDLVVYVGSRFYSEDELKNFVKNSGNQSLFQNHPDIIFVPIMASIGKSEPASVVFDDSNIHSLPAHFETSFVHFDQEIFDRASVYRHLDTSKLQDARQSLIRRAVGNNPKLSAELEKNNLNDHWAAAYFQNTGMMTLYLEGLAGKLKQGEQITVFAVGGQYYKNSLSNQQWFDWMLNGSPDNPDKVDPIYGAAMPKELRRKIMVINSANENDIKEQADVPIRVVMLDRLPEDVFGELIALTGEISNDELRQTYPNLMTGDMSFLKSVAAGKLTLHDMLSASSMNFFNGDLLRGFRGALTQQTGLEMGDILTGDFWEKNPERAFQAGARFRGAMQDDLAGNPQKNRMQMNLYALMKETGWLDQFLNLVGSKRADLAMQKFADWLQKNRSMEKVIVDSITAAHLSPRAEKRLGEKVDMQKSELRLGAMGDDNVLVRSELRGVSAVIIATVLAGGIAAVASGPITVVAITATLDAIAALAVLKPADVLARFKDAGFYSESKEVIVELLSDIPTNAEVQNLKMLRLAYPNQMHHFVLMSSNDEQGQLLQKQLGSGFKVLTVRNEVDVSDKLLALAAGYRRGGSFVVLTGVTTILNDTKFLSDKTAVIVYGTKMGSNAARSLFTRRFAAEVAQSDGVIPGVKKEATGIYRILDRFLTDLLKEITRDRLVSSAA